MNEEPLLPDNVPDDAAGEQAFVTRLYQRLDRMRTHTAALRQTYVRDSDGTPGGRVERDIAYAGHSRTLLDLNAAEDRLCFGRLDRTDGESMHIGRMGIFSDDHDDSANDSANDSGNDSGNDPGGHPGRDGQVAGERRQLLMDWRAPSARPFYVATAAAPLGIRLRRHIRIRRRVVESVSDEYLDISGLPAEMLDHAGSSDTTLTGEAALLAALNAPRTGRMGDIVETIQAEQDRIIRAERNGILVVQGGPGTGKTAVALHRTAYLLYTHRDQLANRGVLVIGPNRTFLTYIGQVLPSLGENAVVLSTMGDLYPGVRAQQVDAPAVAILKGRLTWAKIIANAVLDRQRMPRRAITFIYDGAPLRLDRQLLTNAQNRAWQSRLPHNLARNIFLKTVFDQLARQVARRHRQGLATELPVTAEDFDDIRRELRSDEDLQALLRTLWPTVTAHQLVRDLFTSPHRLSFAAPFLDPKERALLLQDPENGASPRSGSRAAFGAATGGWTEFDVPLLDEAAELLGHDGRLGVAAASRDRAQRAQQVQEVLDRMAEAPVADADDSSDPAESGADEGDSRNAIISAADLLEMQEDLVALTSTAERAGADREWTYGHVVVDEAQELSPMAWRMVMRRCPVRSMTLVGDLAQTGDAAGATSWGSVLRPYVGDHWRFEELTVNYRTPAEITAVADRVLARINPDLTPPTAVRSTGLDPWWERAPAGDLSSAIAVRAADEAVRIGEGHLAVLVPQSLQAAARAAVRARIPGAGSGSDVGRQVVVLTVREAKGLEFDSVIVVEPDLIVFESVRGWNDLYVALTRATQRLGVLYTGELPAIALPGPAMQPSGSVAADDARPGLW